MNSTLAKGIEMTVHKLLFSSAMAAVIALSSATSLLAADNQIALPPGPLAYSAPAPGCPTCGAAAQAGSTGCKSVPELVAVRGFTTTTKDHTLLISVPGACFGYFQTQWRKWDDVCPYPCQGIGVSDAPAAGPRSSRCVQASGDDASLFPSPWIPARRECPRGTPPNFYPQIPTPGVGN